MWGGAHLHVYVHASRGQRISLCQSSVAVCILETRFLITLELTKCATLPSQRELQGSSRPHFPKARIASTSHLCPVLGLEPRSLCLQIPYWRSHYLSGWIFIDELTGCFLFCLEKKKNSSLHYFHIKFREKNEFSVMGRVNPSLLGQWNLPLLLGCF